MCVCVRAWGCTRLRPCVRVLVSVYMTDTCVFASVCVCVCMCVHVRACLWVCAYNMTHACVYVRLRMRVFMCVYVRVGPMYMTHAWLRLCVRPCVWPDTYRILFFCPLYRSFEYWVICRTVIWSVAILSVICQLFIWFVILSVEREIILSISLSDRSIIRPVSQVWLTGWVIKIWLITSPSVNQRGRQASGQSVSQSVNQQECYWVVPI